MKKETAQELIHLSIETSKQYNELLLRLKMECEENEFIEMRNGVAYVLGYMLTDVMSPIFRKFPDLIPDELKDSFKK